MKKKNRRPRFYAIKKGLRSNVVVDTWDEAQRLTVHFSGAQFKSFYTMQEAQAYLAGKGNGCETISFDELSRMQKEEKDGMPAKPHICW
jgi:Predicted double-stranded RNA/RNA-DNA hybrid binding protein